MVEAQVYNSTKPFITKNFEASTAHITEEDDKLIKATIMAEKTYKFPYTNLIVYSYSEGSFIYTFLTEEGKHLEEIFTTLKEEGFSDAFLNLLLLANQEGCKYLQLDCDAMVYEDLPTFNW